MKALLKKRKKGDRYHYAGGIVIPGCCSDRSCTSDTCLRLPDGSKCGGCKNFAYCEAFGFAAGPDTQTCSFFPRRFVAGTAEHVPCAP